MHDLSTRLFLLLFVSFVVTLSGCYPTKSVKIHGQIVDDKTGQPVSDATVCLHTRYTTISTTHSDNLTAKTNAEGEFEFPQIRMSKAVIPNEQTYLRLCAMKKGYDWTELQFDYSGNLRKSLEVRLEPDPEIRLPQGYCQVEDYHNRKITIADEPSFGFAFVDDQLQLVDDGKETDFEIHFKFTAINDQSTQMFGSFRSKSGRAQFLESVTATRGIYHVNYQRTNGHPPRLPDLKKAEFADSFSFEQPCDRLSRFVFVSGNEFLLRTRDGKFALLHFEGSSVTWVYQPDGTLDISRRRKKQAGRHCEYCKFPTD